jgi:hypothetical protein
MKSLRKIDSRLLLVIEKNLPFSFGTVLNENDIEEDP